MTTFSYTLTAPTDQARCGSDDGTTYSVSTNYIPLGRTGNAATIDTGGIVFPLAVPQGATISACTLQITNSPAVGNQGGNKTYQVYADAALTQANFGAGDLPSAAARTTAFGSITNPTNTASTAWTPIDISSVVQEIVNKAGWVSGNLIRLIIVAITTGPYQENYVNAAGNYSVTTGTPSYTGTYQTISTVTCGYVYV